MVEAQITCTCPFIWIADLGLSMKKGQAATVPEVQARASKDLALANTNGGVSVTYIERYKELRTPSQEKPPVVVKPAPKIIHQPPPVKVEKIQLDEDALAKRLAEKMGSLRDTKTNDLIEKLIGEVVSMKKEMNERPQVVREVGYSKGKLIEDDVPMFIPKTIMDEAARDVDLKIEETVSKGNVDEATEALRALRKKKQENKS